MIFELKSRFSYLYEEGHTAEVLLLEVACRQELQKACCLPFGLRALHILFLLRGLLACQPCIKDANLSAICFSSLRESS